MASAQADADFLLPIDPSHAVSFFRSVPRWPSAESNFTYTASYLTSNALTALIPIIFAVLLVLVFLFLLTARFTCYESSVDARLLAPPRSRRSLLASLLLSVPFIFLIFVFIALGTASVTAANFAFRDAVDVIRALVADLSRVGFAFVDVGIEVRNRLVSFSTDPLPSSPLTTLLPDQYLSAFRVVPDYIIDSYPDLGPLRSALQNAVEDITDVLNVVRKAIALASGVLVSICLLILIAPVLLFLLDSMPLNKRSRPWRIFVHLLIVIFPALLSWAMVGLTSAVGTVTSDVCSMFHDYRNVLLDNVDIANIPSNTLIDANAGCPTAIDAERITEQFNGTIDSILQSPLATESVNILLRLAPDKLAETAAWSRDELTDYIDCTKLIQFSGKIEFITCAAQGKSAVEANYDLFVSFLGMALVLSIALFLSLFGTRVTWSLFIWPRSTISAQAHSTAQQPSAESSMSSSKNGRGAGGT